MPEAIVALGEGKRVVGRLRFESDGRRQHSQFEYADEWLAAFDHFALSPGFRTENWSAFVHQNPAVIDTATQNQCRKRSLFRVKENATACGAARPT